jgi:hypothetical protein
MLDDYNKLCGGGDILTHVKSTKRNVFDLKQNFNDVERIFN